MKFRSNNRELPNKSIESNCWNGTVKSLSLSSIVTNAGIVPADVAHRNPYDLWNFDIVLDDAIK